MFIFMESVPSLEKMFSFFPVIYLSSSLIFYCLSTTTEEYVAHNDPASASALTTLQPSSASTAITNSADVYQTWYPPMRNALSLLSKLYGVVELPVFEHFARRSIDLCVAALKKGSEGVKRSRPGLHGDLFLVRHLLMLREQLTPFELRLTSTEKVLDFTSTTEALQFLLSNTRSILRFDQSNGLLTLARTGLPRMQDVTVDAKKELDLVLKSACMSLKSSAVKSLLGGMEAFLVKVNKYCFLYFANHLFQCLLLLKLSIITYFQFQLESYYLLL